MKDKAKEILKNKKTFAVIGVTQDQTKYGYEVFHTLKEFGYKSYPLNPKYNEIAGTKCYSSLKELPEKPEVVVLTLSPANSEKIIEQVTSSDTETIWLPPGCFSDSAVKKCELKGIDLVYNVCPVGILLAMKGGD